MRNAHQPVPPAFPWRTIKFVCAGAILLVFGGCPPIQFPTQLVLLPSPTLSPDSGPIEGGSTVSILGQNFVADTAVMFGELSAAQVTVVSDTELTVITPAHAAGVVDVTILSNGERSAVLADGFEFIEVVEQAARQAVAIITILPISGPEDGGTRVTVRGAGFGDDCVLLINGAVCYEIMAVSDQILTAITPAGTVGSADVTIVRSDGTEVNLPNAFTYTAAPGSGADSEDEAESDVPTARVLGAVATSNLSVLVSFNTEMGPSVTDPSNYEITGSDTAFLVVTAATQREDKRLVDLTTLSQNADTYTLHVVGVTDAKGLPLMASDGLLAEPYGNDPSRTTFVGIAPESIGAQVDSDGDGFADWFEMMGWNVTVTFANGETETFHVTSDPFNPDTDGDGLDDAEENQNSYDPRTDDTDADWLTDYDEKYILRSSPLKQDTDEDGLDDYTEVTSLKTSPILADTDGDQLDDRDELFFRNRNPRLSDIPQPQILIGATNIQVNETFSYTDEQGEEHATESSTALALTESDSKTFAESTTRSNTSSYSFGQSVQFEGGYDGGGVAKLTLGAEFGQELGRGYSYDVGAESSQSAEEAYAEAYSEAMVISENRSVTRNVESASLSAEVTIVNAGDLAFTIRNLELTSRVQDPNPTHRDSYVPLAFLVPGSGNNEFNLGANGARRGPFIFQNTEIFPNLAQGLLREPRAMIFDIANFDLEDEFGRNYAFVSQEVAERTAGITIDYGNGDVEKYNVATAGEFDLNGQQRGISMREALTAIIGLTEVENENAPLPVDADLNDPAIRNSFATAVDPVRGVEVLTRVRGVQSGLVASDDNKWFWAVVTDQDIPSETDFSEIVLKAGDNFMLWYVQDIDNDGLFAREEFLNSSSDQNPDTDSDTLCDFEEIREGWIVAIPGNGYRVYSNPARMDSDGDGLDDPTEKRYATDPRSRDTDEDGISDGDEINGYEISIFDGDTNPNNNPVMNLTPYSDAAIIDGGNGVVDTAVDPNTDDVQLVAVGVAVAPGAYCVGPGANGVIDTPPDGDDLKQVADTIVEGGDGLVQVVAAGDDIQAVPAGSNVSAGTVLILPGLNGVIDSPLAGDDYQRTAHAMLFASDPLRRNTDNDSLFDGREIYLGSNPINPHDDTTVIDTDRDGLLDAQEINGWNAMINGSVQHVTSDPYKVDTDGDNLPDLLEMILKINPRAIDSDGDGLTDHNEFDPAQADVHFGVGVYEDFTSKCSEAINCAFTPVNTPLSTNPARQDTDSDGRTDGDELNIGWTVEVYGSAAPYTVYSDPLQADADLDNLLDGDELAATTDPEKADTDEDGYTDGHELGVRNTNPLRKEKVITFEYTTLLCLGDCEVAAPAPGEFVGTLFLQHPDNSVKQIRDFYSIAPWDGDKGGFYDNTSYDIGADNPADLTFILYETQTFKAYTNFIYEADDGPDDDIGAFDKVFTYLEATPQVGYFDAKKDADCWLQINWSVSVN
jgi:hypothetical protein